MKNILSFFSFAVFVKFCEGVYENNPFLVNAVPPLPATQGNPVQESTTGISVFTIEPPEILHGDLKIKCLQPRGLFPSFSCDKFVNCWDGNAVEQSCSPPLLFNPKGYCDHPQNVECGKKNIPTNDVSSPVNPALPDSSNTPKKLRSRCLRPRGQFQSYSCDKYVNCWDDYVIEQTCPDGLLFSEKGYCDFSYNVKCHGKQQQLKKNLECLLHDGIFRDKNNCSIYHRCIGGSVVATFVCPQGFSFSDNLGVCDYSNRVDCTKEPQAIQFKYKLKENRESNIIETIVSPPIDDTECPVEYGMYRDSKNCAVYYLCAQNEIAARYECPKGFKFNDNIGVCDYEFRVDCKEYPKIFRFKDNNNLHVPKELKNKINNCTPGEIFPLDSNCTMACKCRVGLAEIINCPEGFGYDSKLDKCVLLHLAKC